jgi:hypothetical protein
MLRVSRLLPLALLCHSRKAKIEAQACNLKPIKVISFIFAPVTKVYSQKVEGEAPKGFQRRVSPTVTKQG